MRTTANFGRAGTGKRRDPRTDHACETHRRRLVTCHGERRLLSAMRPRAVENTVVGAQVLERAVDTDRHRFTRGILAFRLHLYVPGGHLRVVDGHLPDVRFGVASRVDLAGHRLA